MVNFNNLGLCLSGVDLSVLFNKCYVSESEVSVLRISILKELVC